MPANPPPAQLLPVVQADRELFAIISPDLASLIYGGDLDQFQQMQAIARHRLAHSPERGELASLVEALKRRLPGAISNAKSVALNRHGIAWHRLEEISKFELVLDALAALHALSASPGGGAWLVGERDPRTGRPFGDHGTANQAIEYALDASKHDFDVANQIEFLKAWREGGAFEEWPEFYAGLADQEQPR